MIQHINTYGSQVPIELVRQRLKENKPQPATAAKTEPPTVVVDKSNRGHFKTIIKAIQTVKPGTRIIVRSGLYRENIIINKTVEIVGVGNRKDIVIQSRNEDAILFESDKGKVCNLTLRSIGSGVFHGVNIM